MTRPMTSPPKQLREVSWMMEPVEISARTVDEAVKIALDQLNASPDEVRVVVLSEGRSGILGLGAEEARVSVELIGPNDPAAPGNAADAEVTEESFDDVDGNIVIPDPELPPDVDGNVGPSAGFVIADGEVTETAISVIERLLYLLTIKGEVAAVAPTLADNEDPAEAPPSFNIAGDDLGILIGRRGQTLAALQYISRLIVSHQSKAWSPLIIDVEGYKQRRAEALRTLALRMADQVKSRGAAFTLEPMPAYERRVIHITLADHPDVTTESIGDGEGRRVVIHPENS
jgi:spoIIIJ-associated protein